MAATAADSRAYVARYIRFSGEPIILAIKGTEVKDASIVSVLREEWKTAAGDVAHLFEIRFSHKKAREFIEGARNGSMFEGPDMYQVRRNGVVVVNVWQPPRLTGKVEVCTYLEGEQKNTAQLSVDKCTTDHLLDLLNSATGKKFERASSSSNRFELDLLIP
jgi:hypothetical protein